jgi:hypothetical protein
MSVSAAPPILFRHIAKTGGTAVLHHMRRGFGGAGVQVLGPHARVRLFFTGLPQPEDMDAQARARLRVVQGHGAGQGAVTWLGRRDLRLMVVLREPVSLTRSRYNQRVEGAAKKGLSVPSRRFLRKLAANPMCSRLVADFPALVDEGAGGLADQALSVLRKFDYVATTEGLSDQLQPMFARYGLPADMERRRVAGQKAELEVGDDEIRALNTEDIRLYEAVQRGTAPASGDVINPLGQDAQAKARAMAALCAQPPEEDRDQALAQALCQGLRAEAALAFLDRYPERVALPDPTRFCAVLEPMWQAKAAHLESRGQTSVLTRSAQLMRRTLKGVEDGTSLGFGSAEDD